MSHRGHCNHHNGFASQSLVRGLDPKDICFPFEHEVDLRLRIHISSTNMSALTGCSVDDVNAFVNIDNDIAIRSQATVKALASEFLEEKQNSSGEDSNVENMYQTPSNKTETIEALEKVRQYLASIQGSTDEEFKVLSILEKKLLFPVISSFINQHCWIILMNQSKRK
ncbi:hypothetical protein AVEN_32819-1 [Araneus ventricosus]|uniref:Uncharacterized protein n=1 Tax=Araneus ventricosus TaxID=182803 RepID=A0A4Y2RCV8_ARAVE|nr:hypothetical protein AVEN_32819-1 [Araneus ventricosus]